LNLRLRWIATHGSAPIHLLYSCLMVLLTFNQDQAHMTDLLTSSSLEEVILKISQIKQNVDLVSIRIMQLLKPQYLISIAWLVDPQKVSNYQQKDQNQFLYPSAYHLVMMISILGLWDSIVIYSMRTLILSKLNLQKWKLARCTKYLLRLIQRDHILSVSSIFHQFFS
jgi:hypothetical protein